MKYSFLLPAFKSRFLKQAIESIISQTFFDFELIVSDDNSPENLKSIVDEFDDKRIVYRRNEKNIGAERMVDHWNLLLSVAKGDYVIMAADDDTYEADFLQHVDDLVLKYPMVDLIRARVRNVNMLDDPIWEDAIYPEFQDEITAVCAYPTVCMGNYVFKRSALNKIGGFFDLPYAMGSDTASAMLMAKNGVANTHQLLFNYRISDLQVSHASKNYRVDRGKMAGAVTFHNWMRKYVDGLCYEHTKLNQIRVRTFIQNHVIRGMLHCARIYSGTLSWIEFHSLFCEMTKIGCFNRKVDKLLFMLDYIRLRKNYKR